MIHVYAFVAGLEELPDLPGVAGAALADVRVDDVVAVVSERPAISSADPRTDAIAHGLVVERLVDTAAAVLPVRFGETFPSEDALRATTQSQAARLREALELVRGCVEIGVRVAAPAAATVAAGSGTEYLRARLAEVSNAAELHERLEPLARASATGRSGETAYLVERADAAAALAVVDAFAAERPELPVACTGPWAPYSFGGGER
jgi:Gas vesicle synthesis protein GvpL/GvpF